MPLIGITGTNGKTTTAYMVMQGAKSAGVKIGMIGTLATFIGDTELPAVRTTPEAPEIFQLLARMSSENVELVVIEVSSIAISEYRIGGLSFDVVGFTNLSHDHLDYHGTMENYFEAKASLFSSKFAKRGVVCVNDAWGCALLERQEIPMQSVYVGTRNSKPEQVVDWHGTTKNHGGLDILDPHGVVTRTHVVSPGEMNALNATLAIAVLDNVGLSPDITSGGVGASVVPGRGQLVCMHNSAIVYVDYAHSPDAIESFLSGLRFNQEGGAIPSGRVITVIGAGGDRDSTKRPLMGAAAARYSDIVIVTDDNPRSEDPDEIRGEIVRGAVEFLSVQVENIEGRKKGINRALELALPGDRIAILGKGHEKAIEIRGELFPFNDTDVILELVHRV
jgi:UDP-N-acetylmuramoyl-L-alanyl-D-glutamate--2,6-diaminopimelate ligase